MHFFSFPACARDATLAGVKLLVRDFFISRLCARCNALQMLGKERRLKFSFPACARDATLNLRGLV